MPRSTPPPRRSAAWGESLSQKVPQCRARPRRCRDLGSVTSPSSAEEPRWSHPDTNGSTQPQALRPAPSTLFPAGHSQCGHSTDQGDGPSYRTLRFPCAFNSKCHPCGGAQNRWGWRGETWLLGKVRRLGERKASGRGVCISAPHPGSRAFVRAPKAAEGRSPVSPARGPRARPASSPASGALQG